jgi:hypothetical protein
MGDDTQPSADADSVGEFCRRHGFSRATFYNLRKAGRGPRVMKVNARILISREAGAEFRRRMEAEAEAEANIQRASAPRRSIADHGEPDDDDPDPSPASGRRDRRRAAPERRHSVTDT